MSARKWPMYTMAIGEKFVAKPAPTSLCETVSRYARETGKRFKTRRVDGGREVRRVA